MQVQDSGSQQEYETKAISCPRCHLSAYQYLSGEKQGLVFCPNSTCGEFKPD